MSVARKECLKPVKCRITEVFLLKIYKTFFIVMLWFSKILFVFNISVPMTVIKFFFL